MGLLDGIQSTWFTIPSNIALLAVSNDTKASGDRILSRAKDFVSVELHPRHCRLVVSKLKQHYLR